MRFYFLLFLISYTTQAQQLDVVDFKRIEASIDVNAEEERVSGEVQATFLVKQNTETVYLDAKNMSVTKSALEAVPVEVVDDKVILKGPFKAGKTYTSFFKYTAEPKQTLYFTGDQVWTQGQGKYTSHWLPSLDDMNDKIEFDISYVSSKHQRVIANGAYTRDTVMPNGRILWKYDMNKPMSSYLVAFAMGDYKHIQMKAESGIPIELYYQPTDSSKVEPTYRHTKQIFDFLEAKIAVPFPWQNYKQVPVRDFLYAGMENTTCTIFAEAFVVDSIGFNDRNYVNVNAHELAHQWFGNLVTESSGTHHWLQEGFATYYALLAEREIFGEDYYYWKLYNSAEQLKALSEEGKGQSLLDPKASSLTFYEKGAWALHMLNELIGEAAFDLGVTNYLKNHSYDNVETNDFVSEIKAVTDIDISDWESDWLQQSAFQSTQAFESLVRSPFMNKYFEVAALRGVELSKKNLQLKTALTLPNDFIGQEAIYQLAGEPFSQTIDLYKRGFESNNLYVRQAMATTLEEIPIPLLNGYESLLNDPSYVTQEAALYNLWNNFPKNRKSYLDSMREAVGFQDKNVRQLWLVLAIATPSYQPENKVQYTAELRGYTAPEYSFEVRQKALGYIDQLSLYDAAVLKNVVNGSVHHNWRFRNFSRELLDSLLENSEYRKLLENQLAEFTDSEQRLIKTKLN